MIIDCISDLHGEQPELDGGDLLIIAGDITADGFFLSLEEMEKDWLRWQRRKYKKVIVIAGNHDTCLEKIPWTWKNVDYLCDSGTEFEGIKIWGCPWTPWFEGVNPHCTAFMLKTEEELAEKWALIPNDIDILITHGPPKGVFDKNKHGKECGSPSLMTRVMDVSPRYHIFGHIHEGYGQAELGAEYYINCSHVNEDYEPVNKPIRIEI